MRLQMATRRGLDARRGRTIQTTSTGGVPEPVPNDDEWTQELTGYFQDVYIYVNYTLITPSGSGVGHAEIYYSVNGGSSWTLWLQELAGSDDSGTASVSVGDLDISLIQLKTEAGAEPLGLGSRAEATANGWEIRVKARKRSAY
jgi:hypothetical protein